MEVVGGSAPLDSLLPGDPRLIDHIVCELKSQGIFDQFRRDCIADVDTKPAYQNLRQRVEGSVNGFLNKQIWKPDMNKNHLREMLRKNIYESGFLETGVERIVDQVVNPKINTIFLPQVEEVVYKFLGVQKPSRINNLTKNGPLSINTVDLLPTDLDPISPDSEVLDKTLNKSNETEKMDDSKGDDDESPPFEPLNDTSVFSQNDESTNDSHLSGISGLTSHESHGSRPETPNKNYFTIPEMSNQDSQLSKVSSTSRLSIVTTENVEKMDICDDTSKTGDGSNSIKTENGYNSNFNIKDQTDVISIETINGDADKNTAEIEMDISDSNDKIEASETDSGTKEEAKVNEIKSENKEDVKDSRNSRDKNRDADKRRSSSKHDSKDRKPDKKSDSSRKSDNKSKSSSSKDKYRDSSKDSKSKSSKDDKDSRSKSKSSSSSSKHRSRSKERSSSSKTKESSSKDKERNRSSKSESKKDDSKRSDSKSTQNDKKSDSSKSSDKKSSSSSKSSYDKKYDDAKSNDSKSRSKSSDSKSYSRGDSKSSRDRKSSSSRDKDRKDTRKSSKHDDHYSSKSDKTKTDRRSTDRDSNDGSSNIGSNSNKDSNSSSKNSKSSDASSFSGSNSGGDSGGQSDKIEQNLEQTESKNLEAVGIKIKKPRFANNFFEARKLMKIRKKMEKMEKKRLMEQSQIDSTRSDVAVRQKDDDKNKTEAAINEVQEEVIEKPISVISKASWDAIEAQINMNIDYDSYIDENADESCSSIKSEDKDKTPKRKSTDEEDCLYFNPEVSPTTERFFKRIDDLKKSTSDIETIIDSKRSRKPNQKYSSTEYDTEAREETGESSDPKKKKGIKRKSDNEIDGEFDTDNNNKKTHVLEDVSNVELEEDFSGFNNTNISPIIVKPKKIHHSPDDETSDIQKALRKANEERDAIVQQLIQPIRSNRGNAMANQRYSSDDLYKPRPLFPGTRRTRGIANTADKSTDDTTTKRR